MQLVFFRLHLVLNACTVRFDMTLWGENFWELNRALVAESLRTWMIVSLFGWLVRIVAGS